MYYIELFIIVIYASPEECSILTHIIMNIRCHHVKSRLTLAIDVLPKKRIFYCGECVVLDLKVGGEDVWYWT